MSKIFSYTLVFLQFAILAIQSYSYGFPFLNLTSLAMVFPFLAVVLSLWTFAHLRPGKFNITPELKLNSTWISSGPFKFIRHPMYSALLLFSMHYLILDFNRFAPYFISLYFVLFFKSRREEKILKESFSIADTYFQTTGRFFPKFHRSSHSSLE
jgi:protein-S-isoprenylcysteine O-methyltransferase Ste14